MASIKDDIIAKLRLEILQAEGFKPLKNGSINVPLGPVSLAFPNGVFPIGALHEFISTSPQDAASSGGFVAGISAALMAGGGACVWISARRKVFPPALANFGITPHQVVFLTVKKDRDLLWTMEEALKQTGLRAVVAEATDVSFTASRRLQLAIEKSGVTAFVLRNAPRNLSPIASVARWRISPLRTRLLHPGMPGIGFPRWTVQLEKVKNGHPGRWQLEWRAGLFQSIGGQVSVRIVEPHRKTG